MAEELERDKLKQIRDPRTGKLLARVDHRREEVELQPYRGKKVWVPLADFLDKKAQER